jgi:uncharacterized membrane protein YfcA
MLNGLDFLFAALAAVAAGAVNALAGGGTLITFPMLTFLGVPAVAANVTNTVALCPGYFGGTLAQWNDLRGQKNRLWLIVPASVVGGVVGGYLLLQTGEKLFKELVPYLILLASGLLAIQDPVRAWLLSRMGEGHSAGLEKLTWLPVGLASVYGGYFGAGLSVIVLSALGLTRRYVDPPQRAETGGRVQCQCCAAIFHLFRPGRLVIALVMAVGALIGGTLGGRLAGECPPRFAGRLW